MALLDIFRSDAFSMHALTAAIEKLPYKPGRIGRMGLFTESPITTPVAMVEEKLGQLSLLQTATRGGDKGTSAQRETRKMRAFQVPHVPYWSTILAESLSGRRAFGTEDRLEIFSDVVNDYLARMKQDHEATQEFHRTGALQGVVYDADGSTVLVDWFAEYGLTQTDIPFNFADPGTLDQAEPVQDAKKFCTEVIRTIENALGDVEFEGIHCFAGDDWWDAFISHATVRRAFERWQDGQFLRDQQRGEGSAGFTFAGITFENYRGRVGNRVFFPTDEATFFPTGVKDIFIEAIAPADFIETVNTPGLRHYAKQRVLDFDKGVELHTQSNVLAMCTRPACLVKSTGSYLNGGPTTTAAPTTT